MPTRAPPADLSTRTAAFALDGEDDLEARRDRVLVAEDNELLGEHLERVLSPHWEVILCRDGHDAWEAARSRAPDLVLTDVMMPGLDGIALCERIKNDVRTREIPVVLVTALGEIEDRLRGFDAGADEYVTKPFAARELVARLRVLLELRRAQRRLLRYAEGLERLVDAQVGHIIEQNQQLTQANRQMEDFLAVAAHDLRSPLVSIEGFVAILREHLEDAPPPQIAVALDRIDVNLVWMSGLTRRLLSLSTVKVKQRVDASALLADLFEKVAERTRDLVEQDGGSLRVEGDRDRRLQVDPIHLEEALVNLVENAAKYRDPARVLEVRLRSCEVSPDPQPALAEGWPGPWIDVLVEDNGRGVPESERERVFEPLVRLDEGVGRGAGLGLHIVRRVVEGAGGKVWLRSGPDKGSTVTLRLPLLAPEATDV